MNTPLSTLQSSNGMAVRIQKHLNRCLAQGDMEGYYRHDARMASTMAAPCFDGAEFVRLCRVYGVEV